MTALQQAIGAGGDTDSVGAILGCWLGALHGETGLPADLLRRIHDGPFGPTHLRELGESLYVIRNKESVRTPGYSVLAAILRNIALYPVVLCHGVVRVVRR